MSGALLFLGQPALLTFGGAELVLFLELVVRDLEILDEGWRQPFHDAGVVVRGSDTSSCLTLWLVGLGRAQFGVFVVFTWGRHHVKNRTIRTAIMEPSQ
jgi:hypothetical protein